MARSLDQTGVMRVNGAWATSVKYEADVVGPRAGMVDLRFMQGRAEIARIALSTDQVLETLGEKNAAAIARHVASDADKYLPTVRGELKGPKLHYGEITLPEAVAREEENSLGVTRDRERAAESPKAAETRDGTDAPERETTPPPTSGVAPSGKSPEARKNAVPEHIAAKYLVKEDRYYFDDQTVAFIDKGSRLTVETQNTAVIKDLVEIAQARGWQNVTLTGTSSFRQAAWHEAFTAGLSVSGYRPSGVELAAANRDRARRQDLPIAAGRDSDPTIPNSSLNSQARTDAQTPAIHAVDEPRKAQAIVYGTLVGHGAAPYRDDATQGMSYFVTLRDESGRERTHWGVGLKEAITRATSQPAIGDRVALERVGSTPVTVKRHAPGAQGEVVSEEIEVRRHQWRIEKEEFLRGPRQRASGLTASPDGPRSAVTAPPNESARARDEEVAAAIRSAETTREELQLKYPELNKAVFRHLAAHDQFAEAYVKAGLIRESDRAQVIAQMRERLARQVEERRPVREPDDKQVSTLIRRSVNRVAADIGRALVEVEPPLRKPPIQEQAQVRA